MPAMAGLPEKRPSGRGTAIALLVVLALVGGVVAVLVAGREGIGPLTMFQWDGTRQPMVVDVDGDGRLEAVGWIRFVGSGDGQLQVAAFDPESGRRIWATETLTGMSQAWQTKAAVAESTLVVVTALGEARGYALATGVLAWSRPLGERARRICGAEPGHVLVETEDERAVTVALASGEVTPLPGLGPCGPIWSDQPGTAPGQEVADVSGSLELPGIRADSHILVPARGFDVVLGSRSPGSPVPMVAVFGAGSVTPRWSAPVPSSPLAAETGAPEVAAIAGDRLVVAHQMADSSLAGHLVCFDLSTGGRLWDAEVPGHGSTVSDPSAVVATDRHVLVSHWTWLEVHDLATGAHVRTIGRW